MLVHGLDPNGKELALPLTAGGGAIKFAVEAINVVGTTTNDNAAAGNVGEYIASTVAVGSAVSLTTATPADITSISLTAGDWEVSGVADFSLAAATVTDWTGGASTTSATLDAQDTYVTQPVSLTTATADYGVPIPTRRVSLAATTTVYLVGEATFSAGAVSAFGTLRARRVR